MGNLIVPVADNLYSTLSLGTPSFPFALYHDDLTNFVQGFVNWHRQKAIEISIILEGRVRVCLLREEHVLTAGDIFMILPDALHSIQPVLGVPSRYMTLIFDPCLLVCYPGSFFDDSFYTPVVQRASRYQLFSRAPNADVTHALLLSLCTFADNSPLSSEAMLHVQRQLQDIWLQIIPHITEAAYAHEDARIHEMIDYLRKRHSEKYSLTHMANAFHVSRGECCRYFKRMMNMTPMEYLSDYRLSRAAELLVQSNKGIAEIALETGFSSPSSFAAEFKKKTGETPRQYRAGIQKKHA